MPGGPGHRERSCDDPTLQRYVEYRVDRDGTRTLGDDCVLQHKYSVLGPRPLSPSVAESTCKSPLSTHPAVIVVLMVLAHTRRRRRRGSRKDEWRMCSSANT
ncbi:hypothetical protein CDEST_08778 [Colletotrichum destructivum]|uniref:Uncharacterized protein n=1 Tax=Colletotrichum destructivum TaxID=34406 RepID=A0AAX4IK89_9PEZI|nr:hypothetical protein CDEST_08778 [Colletotrichum destructivum]